MRLWEIKLPKNTTRPSEVGVLLEDDESLHDGRDGEVLLGGQLGALTRGQQDRRGVRLEAGDGLGLAGLAHHVHGLTHAHAHRQRVELLIESDEHARLHGGGQRVEQVVRLAQDGGLDVEEGEGGSDQPG